MVGAEKELQEGAQSLQIGGLFLVGQHRGHPRLAKSDGTDAPSVLLGTGGARLRSKTSQCRVKQYRSGGGGSPRMGSLATHSWQALQFG